MQSLPPLAHAPCQMLPEHETAESLSTIGPAGEDMSIQWAHEGGQRFFKSSAGASVLTMKQVGSWGTHTRASTSAVVFQCNTSEPSDRTSACIRRQAPIQCRGSCSRHAQMRHACSSLGFLVLFNNVYQQAAAGPAPTGA